jgi:ATP sulfurylase
MDILRWTRKNGKIADSVILKIYQEWAKNSIPKVMYALNVYINNPSYHDKKEQYCYGIMRNATAEKIESKKSKHEQPKSIYPEL